jgi:hypothetical protein
MSWITSKSFQCLSYRMTVGLNLLELPIGLALNLAKPNFKDIFAQKTYLIVYLRAHVRKKLK